MEPEREQTTDTGVTLDEYAVQTTSSEPPPAHAPHRGWLVGIFGGSAQRGRWRLARRLRIVAVFGGASLDLGSAEPEAPESLITVFAFMGGVEIVAPAGIPIQLSGVSLLGGKSDERTEAPPMPGAPLIRVRVFALLGGVKITDRPRNQQ